MESLKFKIPVHTIIEPPRKRDLLLLRLAVLGGVLLLIQFALWYLDGSRVGQPLLFWLLTFSLGYKALHLLYEWAYLASLTPPPERTATRDWEVDMLTTYVPGEPYDMIVDTLKAMVAVRYPHTTYLCDEGNDPYLRRVCEELGVVHVYRGPDKTGAKAGNINFALQHVAKGEICVILDPDHVPAPEFLDRVLPHFEDPKVGFVQCIQAYGNTIENFVARGAAEQTFSFYDPLMMGMQRWGTVQAIGANCTFRRAALDEIGGHAVGLCEDMHTSMQLHARQWTSMYVPELLTRGRAPATLSAFYKQQLKWTRGCFDLLFHQYPRLFRKWSWPQRLHYLLTPLFFFYGVIGLIDIGLPLVALLTCHVPLFIYFEDFLWRILPLLGGIMVIRLYAQRYLLEKNEKGFHFLGGVLRVGTWWVYLLGFLYALAGVKVPYLPTPKEGDIRNEWKISLPNLTVIGLGAAAIFYGLSRDWSPFSLLMAGFAAVNVFLLSTSVLIGQQQMINGFLQSLKSGALYFFNRAWYRFRHNLIYRPTGARPVALAFLLLAAAVFTHNLAGDFLPGGGGSEQATETEFFFPTRFLAGEAGKKRAIPPDGRLLRADDYAVFKLPPNGQNTLGSFAAALAESDSLAPCPSSAGAWIALIFLFARP